MDCSWNPVNHHGMLQVVTYKTFYYEYKERLDLFDFTHLFHCNVTNHNRKLIIKSRVSFVPYIASDAYSCRTSFLGITTDLCQEPRPKLQFLQIWQDEGIVSEIQKISIAYSSTKQYKVIRKENLCTWLQAVFPKSVANKSCRDTLTSRTCYRSLLPSRDC